MPSEATQSGDLPQKGLPPVVPPTGKYIVQLFLVPGLIVTVALVWLLGFSWLAGNPGDPAKLLAKLDSSNAEVRWRAASDLAQVLLRDDQLAADPKFALDLATRLRRSLQENAETERIQAERARQSPASAAADPTVLEAERNYILYLAACLGSFALPAGVPALADMAVRNEGVEPQALLLRRRQALWAIANHGENLKRFDRLSPERREAIRSQLAEESAAAGERGELAKTVSAFLERRLAGQATMLGLADAFARCAQEDDPFLRELVAFSLNFWEGTPEENARMDEVLVRLSHDDGHGATDASARAGLTIRCNAAVALARRGSDKARLELLRDLLDDEAQLGLFRTKTRDGRDVPDEAAARTATINALKAITDLHRRRPERDLSSLLDAIDRLTKSGNALLRAEAAKTRIALRRN